MTLVFIKTKQQSVKCLFCSLHVIGTAKDTLRGPSNKPARSVKNVTERTVYEVGCCCFAWFFTLFIFIVRLWQCYCVGTWELTTAYGALLGRWLTREKIRTSEVNSSRAVVFTTNPQTEPRRLPWIADYCVPDVCWGQTAISQPNKFAVCFWKFNIKSRYAWQNTFSGMDQYACLHTRRTI
jgi:hypothetical protein